MVITSHPELCPFDRARRTFATTHAQKDQVIVTTASAMYDSSCKNTQRAVTKMGSICLGRHLISRWLNTNDPEHRTTHPPLPLIRNAGTFVFKQFRIAHDQLTSAVQPDIGRSAVDRYLGRRSC